MKRTQIQRSTKPMNRVGRKGRKNLALSRELTAKAKADGYDFCELASVLSEMGIDHSPCFGPLTNAHSVKSSVRAGYTSATRAFLDRETARGCEHHHYDVTDHQTHEMQLRIVRTAIARRNQ